MPTFIVMVGGFILLCLFFFLFWLLPRTIGGAAIGTFLIVTDAFSWLGLNQAGFTVLFMIGVVVGLGLDLASIKRSGPFWA